MSHHWRPPPQFPFYPPPQNHNYPPPPPAPSLHPTPPPHPIPPPPPHPHHHSVHPPQGIPPPPPQQPLKRPRLTEFDNERRLRLVRDHGFSYAPPYRYETEINGDVYDRVLGNRGYLPPLPNSPPPPIPVEPPPLPPVWSPRPIGFSVEGVEQQHRRDYLRGEMSRVSGGFGVEEAQHHHPHDYLRNEMGRGSGGFGIEEAQHHHRHDYLRNEMSRSLGGFGIEEAQHQRDYLRSEMGQVSSDFGIEDAQHHRKRPYYQNERSRVPAGFSIENDQKHQQPYLRSDLSRVSGGFSSQEAQQQRESFSRSEPRRVSDGFNSEGAQQHQQPYLQSEPNRFLACYNIEEAQQQMCYLRSEPSQFSTGFRVEGVQGMHRASRKFGEDSQSFQSKQVPLEKAKVVDAAELFKVPHRVTRPDHFVIILRGLPGSGKSYLAKMFRDMEVENGGAAPRIHSMDEYFMTEVEKEIDENESSSMIRGKKKPVVKTFMEYCYEPEMEEAYRASMLKAFKKTLDDGVYTIIIVDDRNLRVADFAQFWAFAKRSGYEVYVLEAPYKDPVGCAARNVHGFNQDDIQEMAGKWEEAPPLYLQLDVKSLLRGDDLKESDIQEVDMDMDTEGDFDEGVPVMQERKTENIVAPYAGYNASDVSLKDKMRWEAEDAHPTEVKGLGLSKWSEDLNDDAGDSVGVKGKTNSLSGRIQVYSKKTKSVHWGDQGGSTGFSIAAAKKANMSSLVIGPGAGYNLKSNPRAEEDSTVGQYRAQSKGRHSFQERLQAERQSFKAVFDRRRQRIGGLGIEDM